MTAIQRFLLFVPPILFLCFPAFAQIQGKLTQMLGTATYQVAAIPTLDMGLPLSATSSAQIVIRAKTGTLNPTNIIDITGDWEKQNQFDTPVEAPDYDYFVFFMINPLTTITYTNGVEVPLFSFENNGPCTGIEIIDNSTDPFAINNTLMVNAENAFSILSAGPGANAYEGNSNESSISCGGVGMEILADANPVPCFGDVTNINVKAVEGTAPYTVRFEHLPTGAVESKIIPTFEGTATFSNVPSGAYRFEIMDIIDSMAVDTFPLMQPPPLEVELLAGSATCSGSRNGNALIEDVDGVSGDTISAYQYFWDVDPSVSNTVIDSLDTGNYTVTVQDINGCTTSESVFVGVYNELFIQDVIIDISCYGENNGIIDITPFGVAPPYEFHWSPNANSDISQSAAWMLGPGEYHVTVTASGGVCSRTETFFVNEPEEIQLDYETVEPICFGEEAFLNILNIDNTQGTFNLTLSGNHTALSSESFIVEAGIPMSIEVEDSEGCTVSDDFIIPDAQEISVVLGDDVTINYGETVYIDSEVHPLTGVDMVWLPDVGLSCSDCPSPVAAPLETTNYQLVLTDDNGCTATDDILITVEKSRNIYIPNAFSPNKDGINEVFRPEGGFEIVMIHSMMIFDRWGGLIYSNDNGFRIDDVKIGWDGTSNGKELDPGTYLYTMSVEFIDGETVPYKGNIMIIK